MPRGMVETPHGVDYFCCLFLSTAGVDKQAALQTDIFIRSHSPGGMVHVALLDGDTILRVQPMFQRIQHFADQLSYGACYMEHPS